MVLRNNKRILAIYAACVLSALLLASCNFFEWLNPPVEGVSWQAYVARGDRYFEDKYFDKAMDSYSNALILNPYSSQARSGYARSTFWQFVPGFMNLLAIKMAESTNGSVYDVLLEVFNSEEGRQAINAGADSAFYERIVATLDSPYGIVNGTSDNVVSSENFEMNLMLIVAYAAIWSFHCWTRTETERSVRRTAT
jgi:tetratricopeptide (TPR) repeat protein